MDDTWLVFIGLGKLPTNFQRHVRSHLAKLDFNVLQRMHQKELGSITK